VTLTFASYDLLPRVLCKRRRIIEAELTKQAKVQCWKAHTFHALASKLLTDLAYQCPPRGVLMPLALSASAIW
jgi:hypothetical protein